jgi:hypothetical protein
MIHRLRAIITSLYRWLIRVGIMVPPGEVNGREIQLTDGQRAARKALLLHSLKYPPTPGRW